MKQDFEQFVLNNSLITDKLKKFILKESVSWSDDKKKKFIERFEGMKKNLKQEKLEFATAVLFISRLIAKTAFEIEKVNIEKKEKERAEEILEQF